MAAPGPGPSFKAPQPLTMAGATQRRLFGQRCGRPNNHLQRALNVQTQTVRSRKHDGGQYESSCSRSSRFGAFSGCRIGPGPVHPGVPPLRLCTLWLRLLQLRLRLPLSPLRLPSSLRTVSLLEGTLRHRRFSPPWCFNLSDTESPRLSWRVVPPTLTYASASVRRSNGSRGTPLPRTRLSSKLFLLNAHVVA
jgi:hypothetical protein